MTFEFNCQSGGNTHTSLPSFGPNAPHAYDGLDPRDQSKRALLGVDNCIIDNAWFFVRGRLEIPIHGHDQPFTWLVWVSLSKENYQVWEDTYDQPKRADIGPFFGWLNSQLPFYDNTLNFRTMVHLVDDGLRPVIEVEDIDHPLSRHQKDGISMETAQQFANDLLQG